MFIHYPARGFSLGIRRNPMSLITYFKETRAELKHVTWPTRKQAIMYTTVVIVISLFTAAYLGFFDYVFSALLKIIV